MSAQVFCLVLGALMGALIMGITWMIATEIARRPERRDGQRTNRPEQWVRTQDGWVFRDDYIRHRPAPVRKNNDELVEAAMKDELEKVLKKLDERREKDDC